MRACRSGGRRSPAAAAPVRFQLALCAAAAAAAAAAHVAATSPLRQHRARGETAGCSTDEDCSLLGVCAGGACRCDPGWTGDDCGTLDLLPVTPGTGYNLTGDNPPTSTWGANIFPEGDGVGGSSGHGREGRWTMVAAEFENHCDISAWSPNSAIVHAVSDTGPQGPYRRVGVLVEPFAHNPKVVRAPDGTWLMYTIGTPVPASRLVNCSHGASDGAAHSKSATAAAAAAASATRPSAAAPPPPGRTPKNLESNVTLFTSSQGPQGPWKRFGVVLGPDFDGAWDEDTSNPSPWVLPNGTVLLAYRGCVVWGGGCVKEFLGVSSAPHWSGPYTRLTSTPILPGVGAEDPSLWVDHRGNFHLLMHYIAPDSDAQVARHAFARSFTGPWQARLSSVPYNTTVAFTDGAEVTLHKRERPHLVFGAGEGGATVPTHLVTGVVLPKPNQHGYSGLSFTLVQPVRAA